MNYQNRGLSHLPKQKAEANNTDTRFDNSGYHAKIEFNKCFIITFLNNRKRGQFSLSLRKFENITPMRGLETRFLNMITQYLPQIYMLFAGWEVRMVKNCDRGLENAVTVARGQR